MILCKSILRSYRCVALKLQKPLRDVPKKQQIAFFD